MRAKVKRGGGGRSLNQYLFDELKRQPGREAENPIFHTNMVGRTPEELAEEFRFAADQNSKVQRIVAHFSVSFPPGENPVLETKRKAVDLLLTLGGFKEPQHSKNDCMFFALEHFDKLEKQDVHHLHIVVSTVRPDGSRVSDSFEQLRLKKIERTIELELGLQYCPAREKGERRNLTTGEARQEERTGQPCLKRQLWQAIDQATADHPTMAVALMRVKAAGFEVRFAEYADGGKGISFGAEERYFRGGRLGDRYSFNGLQKYAGVSYHPQKDDSLLRQLEQMSQQQCQQQLQTIAQEQRERERQEQERQRLEELRRQQAQQEQERLERERLQQQQQAEAERLAKFQQEQDQWIDEIVPTAIEAVRWNKRNPKFVHRINESQIEISGSAYWALWNNETRQLDYYRRADGQHLFTATREADQDSWTFQQISDLTQADLDFHRQAATRLAELYEAIEVETNEAEEEEEEEEERER